MSLKPLRVLASVSLSGILLAALSCGRRSRAASGSTSAPPPPLQVSMVTMTPDQANTATWTKGWTNLVNDARQTFTPSLPRLIAVEVQLVVGNAGMTDDTVTMTLRDATGESLAATSRTVSVDDCDHALFVLRNGGVEVMPGEVYSISLGGGTTFGWKYVVGGYENGAASFNGRPLLPGARSTFLFRTFGTK